MSLLDPDSERKFKDFIRDIFWKPDIDNNDLPAIIDKYGYDAFQNAAWYNRTDIMNIILKLTPYKPHRNYLLVSNHIEEKIADDILTIPVEKGYTGVVNILLEIALPRDQNLIIDNIIYKSHYFISTIKNGHIEIFNKLWKIFPNDVKSKIINSIENAKFEPFKEAIENGHTDIIDKLFETTSFDMHKKMIDSISVDNFRKAVESGHLSVIAILAYHMNDISKMNELFHYIDDKKIHNKIKIYKQNPGLLIDLGKAYHILFEQNQKSEEIEKAKLKFVETASILSKTFRILCDADKSQILHIIDYLKYDFKLTEEQNFHIIEVIDLMKTSLHNTNNNYDNKIEADIGFLNRLIEERQNSLSYNR